MLPGQDHVDRCPRLVIKAHLAGGSWIGDVNDAQAAVPTIRKVGIITGKGDIIRLSRCFIKCDLMRRGRVRDVDDAQTSLLIRIFPLRKVGIVPGYCYTTGYPLAWR